jgi:hypothetical protein
MKKIKSLAEFKKEMDKRMDHKVIVNGEIHYVYVTNSTSITLSKVKEENGVYSKQKDRIWIKFPKAKEIQWFENGCLMDGYHIAYGNLK